MPDDDHRRGVRQGLPVMAALMIPGGKLTDRYGRKRCFMAGLTVYGAGAGAALSAVAPARTCGVSGSLHGIGANTMWIVTKPDAGDGYCTTIDAPIATSDGNWSFEDQEVGDETDVGHEIPYIAVQADQTCSQGLSSVDTVTPRSLPVASYCTWLAPRPGPRRAPLRWLLRPWRVRRRWSGGIL